MMFLIFIFWTYAQNSSQISCDYEDQDHLQNVIVFCQFFFYVSNLQIPMILPGLPWNF